VSKSQPDGGDWGSGSASLFRASRADHDPTASDRARVRDALARRLAAGAVVTTAADGAQSIAPKSARGLTLGNIVKVSVAVALVVTGSFAAMRTLDSSERSQPTQPVAPAPVPTSSSAMDQRPAPAQLARPESSPLNRPAARHLRSHSAPAKRATFASHAAASSAPSRAELESAPVMSAAPDSAVAASADFKAPTPAAGSRAESAALSRPSAQEPAARGAATNT
jgi:hypothetical protein